MLFIHRVRVCAQYLLPIIVGGAALLIGSPCPAQSAAGRSGWDAIADSQPGAARAAFKRALQLNPADASALNGLALTEDEADEEAAALSHWRTLYRVAPGSWQAAAAWPGFVQTAETLARWDVMGAAAHDILMSPKTVEALRASAQQVQLAAIIRAGRFADAKAFQARLGYLRSWQAIGPFENVSKSGFDRAYAPEQGIDLHASLVGQDGRTLGWHPLMLVDADGSCDVSDALGADSAAVFYAATTVVSPSAQSAILRYDPGCATKVFLNGLPIISDDLERDQQSFVADQFAVPVTLKAGPNTILVKLATEDVSQPASEEFAMRLTTKDGTPLVLRTDTGTEKIDPVLSPSPAVTIEPVVAAMVRTQPASLERTLARNDLLYNTSDYQTAEDEARRALAVYPDCSALHWQLSYILNMDDQENEAKLERETAVARDPGNLQPKVNALKDQGAALPPSEYVARLKALLAVFPASGHVLWALADALNDAKLTDAALTAARAAVRQQRGSDAYIHLANLYREAGRTSDAKAALIEGLTYTPNGYELVEKLAALNADLGDTHGALAKYSLLTDLKESVEARLAVADLATTIKRPDLAMTNLLRARQDCPQGAEICSKLSDQDETAGRRAQALALLAEAVRLAPEKLDLRDKQQLLAGSKPVIDLAAPVSSASALAGGLGRTQNAPGVYLLDEAREVVYPDGATMTRYHQIVRVLDAAGVALRQNYALDDPSYTARVKVESARVTTAAGKIEDQTDAARGASVPFPSLAPGDTIDITYRVEDYHKGALAHQFWTEWYFQSGLEMPSRLSRFVLITPPDMTFRTLAHGAVPEPTVKDAAGWRIREWRMADVPVLKHVALGLPARDCGTWLDISSIDSWNTIVQWYRGLSYTQCVPDAEVRAKAAELTAGAATPQDKMRAVVAYVARKIQYQTTPFRLSAYIPTEGKQVIRDQYGDCKDKAALLTALLACVGIKSEMVLLSPRDAGVTAYLPSPRFNHSIAYVQAPEGPEFIDATADQLGFGLLPSPDQQVPVLLIDDKTQDLTLTPTEPITQNVENDVYTLTLDEDGTLHGDLAMTFQGQWGWYLRSALKQVPASHQDEVVRYLITKAVPNGAYESGDIKDVEEQDQPLLMHAKFHVDNDGAVAGNFLLTKLPWAGQDDSISQLLDPARAQDVELSATRGDYFGTLDLTLPAGYVPQDLERDKTISSDWGSYEVHYTVEAGVLHGRRETRLTAMRVALKDIPAYVAFFKAIKADESKQLVLLKGGAAP